MNDEVENLEQDNPAVSEVVSNDGGDSKLDRETVSKIVARERQKAYEKAKQEIQMELEQQSGAQQQGGVAESTAAQKIKARKSVSRQGTEDQRRSDPQGRRPEARLQEDLQDLAHRRIR